MSATGLAQLALSSRPCCIKVEGALLRCVDLNFNLDKSNDDDDNDNDNDGDSNGGKAPVEGGAVAAGRRLKEARRTLKARRGLGALPTTTTTASR